MNPNTIGSEGGIQSFVVGSGRDGRQYLHGGVGCDVLEGGAQRRRDPRSWLAIAEEAMIDDESALKGRGLIRHLLTPLSLVALLGLPGVSHALAPASASSFTVLTCGTFQSVVTQLGVASEDCLIAADSVYSPAASASVRTVLGERPMASVTAENVGEFGKFKSSVQASAQLTYEVRLVALAAPPGVALPDVPVTVAVRGEVKRYSERENSTTSPLAIGSALVSIRSSPNIQLGKGDVLNEQAVRHPNYPLDDSPDFDKIVAISLVPGHTYIVDLVAGCRLNVGSLSFETIATRSSCSAEADPVFMLDQATLDKRLGASSFALSAYYGFEYSAGVTSPIPEPGSAVMALFGLAGLGAYSRRARSRGAAADCA